MIIVDKKSMIRIAAIFTGLILGVVIGGSLGFMIGIKYLSDFELGLEASSFMGALVGPFIIIPLILKMTRNVEFKIPEKIETMFDDLEE